VIRKASPVVTTSLIPRISLPKISQITSSKSLQGFYLATQDNPDQKFPLDKLTNVIGRELDCDIVIDDKSVSRRHCLIEVTSRGLLFRDLDSKNGSFVNGTFVSEEFVTLDDVIRLGNYKLWLRRFPVVQPMPSGDEENRDYFDSQSTIENQDESARISG
jgi:pSer/pThr/pTyr-binding forkhead associated (FHA) protein